MEDGREEEWEEKRDWQRLVFGEGKEEEQEEIRKGKGYDRRGESEQ